MNKLQKKIVSRIQNEGAIPFREFMAICLYEEEHGYYQTRTTIGREGDFFTSAHLGSILGRILGKRVMDLAPEARHRLVFRVGEAPPRRRERLWRTQRT